MEIFALEGHKVRVTKDSIKNGDSYDIEKARKYLEVGKTYTVDETIVDDWHTDVIVKEIPDVQFNSVNFEDAVEQPEELTKQHPDFRRYNE